MVLFILIFSDIVYKIPKTFQTVSRFPTSCLGPACRTKLVQLLAENGLFPSVLLLDPAVALAHWERQRKLKTFWIYHHINFEQYSHFEGTQTTSVKLLFTKDIEEYWHKGIKPLFSYNWQSQSLVELHLQFNLKSIYELI